MNFLDIERIVRAYLQDFETETEKRQFWDRREILLALNMAQNMFVLYAINNKLIEPITQLIKKIEYTVTENSGYYLPDDYYYPLSAEVIYKREQNIYLPCKIFMSADFIPYITTTNAFCVIGHNDTIDGYCRIGFYINRQYPVLYDGRLTYVQKPRPITTSQFPMVFNENIYRLIILKAIMILASKELTNFRDTRIHINNMAEKFGLDKNYINYLNNKYDIPMPRNKKEGLEDEG